MTRLKPSRRDFLKNSSAAAGGAWLSLSMAPVIAAARQAQANREAGAYWANLTETEAHALAAMVDQIFPPGDTPGAADIGVVQFIDAALGSFSTNNSPAIKSGLADLDSRSQQWLSMNYADLDFDRQTELLQTLERTSFFNTVHGLTLQGLFAMPAYGGNKNQAGWELLGYEARHAWQPPFGYYDAQAAEGDEDAGT